MSDALVPTPSLPARRARLPPPRLQWSRRPGARLPPLRRRRGPPARPPRGAPSLPHRGGGRARVARRPDPSRGDGRGPGRVRRGARGVRQGGAAGAVGPHLLPGGRAGRAHGQPRPRGRLPDREPPRSAEPRGAGRPGRASRRRVGRRLTRPPRRSVEWLATSRLSRMLPEWASRSLIAGGILLGRAALDRDTVAGTLFTSLIEAGE